MIMGQFHFLCATIVLALFPNSLSADKFNWTSTPTSSLTILYGQNLTLTWNVDLSPSITFQSATVWQTKGNNRNPVISYYVNGSKSIFGQTFQNRTADLALTAIQSGSIVSIRFEYAYLIKSTDEGAYDASVTAASEITDVSPNKTNVTINDREIWMTYPPSLTRIQGQSMTLIWKGNFPYQKFLFAKVWISKNGNKEDVAFYKAENGTAEARGSYINRSAHISLTVSQIRSVVIVTFVLENLLKNTDEGAFDLTLTLSDNTITAPKTPLMINVIKKVVKSTFKCNSCTYESGLGDHRSIVFNTLKEKIEKMLRLVYAVHKYVKSVDVSAFWPGSVIVEFKLTLIANVSDPLSPFKAAVCKQGGSLEGINIDLNSIQEGTYILPTTTISTTVETAIETTASTGTYILPTTTISTTVETAIETTASTESCQGRQGCQGCQGCQGSQVSVIVLGVLFGVSLIFNVIFVGYFIWRHLTENSRHAKKSENINEVGYMNTFALQEQPTSTDGQNVVQYEPVGNGREQESANTTMYQSVSPHTDTYSTLSPSTKLPLKPAGITTSGIYQDIPATSQQYQSLDSFSRV